MNSQKIADALNIISEGFAALALAIESPSTGVLPATVEQPRAGAVESPPAPLAPAGMPPSFDELPPNEMFAESISPNEERPILSDVGLGYCPEHRKSWKVVPAGTSKKTGKGYSAFYACPERGCDSKPFTAWRDSHPINQGAAA
jgi:hypothetical protein